MKKHIHKYQRIILGDKRIIRNSDGRKVIERKGGQDVMKCMIVGCKHFIARELTIGRQSICWMCGNDFVLNPENSTLKQPICSECREKRKESRAS